jgi:phosphopantetheine adenylyltransferase
MAEEKRTKQKAKKKTLDMFVGSNNENIIPIISEEIEIKDNEIVGRKIEVDLTEKDKTAWNLQQEEEEKLKEQKEKLPLDKILDIAKAQGLLKDLTEEQRFDRLIKGIKLHDIIKDCMQSSLNNYSKEYNKKNPDDNIQLKLMLHNNKHPQTGAIFSADLRLECRRRGKFIVLLKKGVAFTHVRQVRDEASWKYSLYGNMFNDLIAVSINHLLLTDDVQSGRIKSTIPA